MCSGGGVRVLHPGNRESGGWGWIPTPVKYVSNVGREDRTTELNLKLNQYDVRCILSLSVDVMVSLNNQIQEK